MAEREVDFNYVRGVYAHAPVERCEHENRTPDYAAEQFDHWLATHDAAVEARALIETADAWEYYRGPWTLRRWIRERGLALTKGTEE